MVPRIFRVTIALTVFLAGLVMIFLPVPEIPFFLVSGALLAAESLPLARFLDRTELRGRSGWNRLKRRSGLSPRGVQLVVLALMLGTLALSSGFCYHTFLR